MPYESERQVKELGDSVESLRAEVARLDADIDHLFGLFGKLTEAHNGLDDDVDKVWKRFMTALSTEGTGRHAAPDKEKETE